MKRRNPISTESSTFGSGEVSNAAFPSLKCTPALMVLETRLMAVQLEASSPTSAQEMAPLLLREDLLTNPSRTGPVSVSDLGALVFPDWSEA
ncbi:hypothetical protein DBR22_20900 [Arthrobacter sp. HMWF013]|nr:hypothetical protein DBR22_20900 [Arthrobacter sp. HMWF013]